jgi:hypothetical protein
MDDMNFTQYQTYIFSVYTKLCLEILDEEAQILSLKSGGILFVLVSEAHNVDLLIANQFIYYSDCQ